MKNKIIKFANSIFKVGKKKEENRMSSNNSKISQFMMITFLQKVLKKFFNKKIKIKISCLSLILQSLKKNFTLIK